MRGSNQAGSHAAKGTPSPASEPVSAFARNVSGRPTGYSAGANERAWKQATRAVFEGCVLLGGCRVRSRSTSSWRRTKSGGSSPTWII